MLSTTSPEYYAQLKTFARLHTPKLYEEILYNPRVCPCCGCVEDFDNVFINDICDECLIDIGIDIEGPQLFNV